MSEIENIAIFKLNEDVQDFKECLKKDNNGNSKARDIEFKTIETENIKGKFYFNESQCKAKTEKDLPWLAFMNEKLAQSDKVAFDSANKLPRGLFIYNIEIDKNVEGSEEENKTKTEKEILFYAMAFGQGGESYLNKDKVVSDFGIKVAMNICDPKAIKSIQTSQHESISIQSEKQIHTGAGLSIFDIDYDEEFFKKVSGKAKSEYDFISSVSGAERIQLKFEKENKLSWDTLFDRTEKLENLYKSKSYKDTEFKSFDNWKYETNKSIINELDATLVEKFKNNALDKISLTVPEFIDTERFTFSYKHDDKEVEDLILKDLLNEHDEVNSIETVKRWPILKNDKENDSTYHGWSAYRCLVAEVERNEKKYILFDGKWREVSSSFQEEVEGYLLNNNITLDENALDIIPNDINIYDESSAQNRESVFNEQSAKHPDLFLFDKAKLEIAGHSKYEVCDLFSKHKELIQVKKYENGASSLSHLFVQAKFYGDAFILDKKLRDGMRNFVSEAAIETSNVNYEKDTAQFLRIIPSDERPSEKEYTIILCILSEGRLELMNLPFMTLYSIYQTHKHLTVNRNYNFKIINRTIKKGKDETLQA